MLSRGTIQYGCELSDTEDDRLVLESILMGDSERQELYAQASVSSSRIRNTSKISTFADIFRPQEGAKKGFGHPGILGNAGFGVPSSLLLNTIAYDSDLDRESDYGDTTAQAPYPQSSAMDSGDIRLDVSTPIDTPTVQSTQAPLGFSGFSGFSGFGSSFGRDDATTPLPDVAMGGEQQEGQGYIPYSSYPVYVVGGGENGAALPRGDQCIGTSSTGGMILDPIDDADV